MHGTKTWITKFYILFRQLILYFI